MSPHTAASGVLHRVFAPITSRLSLAGRVAVLTIVAVAATLTLMSVTVFWMVRTELVSSLDEAMFKRVQNTVAAGFTPGTLTPQQAELLSLTGIQLLTIESGGGAFMIGRADQVPYDDHERAVAIGEITHSARTARIDDTPYRIVAIQAGPGQAIVLAQSMESTQAALDRLVHVLILTSGAGILLAGLAGWGVATNGIRPVRRLRLATEHVARTGDLTPLASSGKTSDELTRLTASFNAMLEALSAAQRRERQLIADAGHELRTPLTSLRTNIDLLRQVSADPTRALDPADHADLLDDIGAQLTELGSLVGDLTELARDEPIHRDPEPVDLAEVTQRAIDRVRLRANDVDITATLTPSPVFGDSQMLERAVTNLLDNAVKWSPRPGEVTVDVCDGVVTVTDHGPGIAAEDQPHVFERFWRAPDARALPGSGLGLSIVKRTADRHGGTVQVTSSPGQGTTMRLHIPVTRTPA